MNLRSIAFVPLLITLGQLSALSGADTPNPNGFPKAGDPGGGIGAVRIWYADNAWHLRTSTENSEGKKDKLMVFTGTVTCEDKITADGNKLELKGKGKTADTLTPHADGKGFDFRFATYGALDQVDFTIAAKGKILKFKLQIDGQPAAVDRIVIGEKGGHPAKAEFTLPALPKK